MKEKSILKNFSLISILVTIVAILIGFFTLDSYKKEIKNDLINETKISLQNLIKIELQSKLDVGISNAISIANDRSLQQSLASNDRELAISSLKHLSKNMKENTPFKNIKVHIHTKDNYSFLRSWKTNKFGDDLSSFRKSVVKVNKSKFSVNGYEIGKAGLSIRSVVPIFKDGVHLGSLEFMQGVNSVAKSFDKTKDGFLFLMDNSLAIAKLNEDKKFKNYTISQKFINQDFLEDARTINMQEFISNRIYISEKYLYTYSYIKDFNNKKIGIAIAARPLDIVMHTIEDSSLLIYTALALLVISLFITLIINIMSIKTIIIKPLTTLKEAIDSISEDKNATKIPVVRNDEIGCVVHSFNNYLNSIQKDLEQDEKVIKEAEKVMGKVSVGLFNDRIKGVAASPEVTNMIDSINKMIEITEKNITSISDSLTSLSKAKYDAKIPKLENVTGLVASILTGVKVIQSTSSEVMSLIDNSNKRLTRSAQELTQTANNLSISSNQQAAALEETAAAIEEVTSTIDETSQSAAKMSQYAQSVTKSSQVGISLATKTSEFMDKLSSEVNTINEAITVIDQIAFQTNILSLNAAVEAATAGEAGKGFAVVAQEVRNLASRSAEAANEIKALVESATTRAKEGKDVSAQMIEGFNELNVNINTTIDLIDYVANATQEQKGAMEQINNTVNSLDKETQKNATEASHMSQMAKQTEDLVELLQSAVNRTSFSGDSKKRACDANMIFDLNKLKSDHVNLKNINFSQCELGKTFKVKKHTECDMGKWIIANENSEFAQTKLWEELKKSHQLVHHMIQDTVDLYCENYENGQIISVTQNLEKQIDNVFVLLDKVKEYNCTLQSRKNGGA